MALNGWQRLWVLFAALWAGVTALLVYSSWPQPVEKSRSEPIIYVQGVGLVQPEKGQTAEEAIAAAKKDPSLAIAKAPPPEPPTDAERNDLYLKRRSQLVSGLRIWAVPCVVVYASGFGIAWVRRGFRQPGV